VSPNKEHKTDYLILGILGALTAGVLFAFVFWGWVKENRTGLPGIRTTQSTNVDAVIVCYTLFERLGISVGRSETILLDNAFDKSGVLFLLDPIIPVHSGEIKEIKAWLLGGGVLICTDVPKGLHPDLDKLGKGKNILCSSTCRINQKPKKLNPIQTTSIPSEHKNLPLARDISSIFLKTHEIVDVNVFDPNDPRTAFEPLLLDSFGPRMVEYKLGRGRIILVSDSSFLANGQIGKQDNSVLAVNLVSYALSQAKNKSVLFDEYHLGFGHHKSGLSVLSWMMFTTPAGWTVVSLTIAGVLFMFYKGRRFGTRRGFAKGRRRSKLEYIYAVGSTYHSAGANRLTLELILNWLKRKVTNSAGLAQNASNGAIATKLSLRSDLNSQGYKEVLDKCDRYITQADFSERQLLLTIKQLAQIEKEVFNERRKRK